MKGHLDNWSDLLIAFLLFWFSQFERDGYLVLDDFYSEDEIDEMLNAGRDFCSQAPKEERRVFSAVDSSTAQVF